MFPVEERIAEIRHALGANRSVVLTAPPGSGKTTCVPPALLDEPWLEGKKIVMLEPRRLAARNCATFMAARRGEAPGGTIGYQVRLERKISSKTRLEVVTEGLLAQRLLADPELSDVGLVIFDEFHERSLQCDLAFAMALDVRRALRPDLRLMVMSATLEAGEVVRHLGDAEAIHAEGRMYPVETAYLGDASLTAAVRKAVNETDGDILCFLPGEGEIRRLQATLTEMRLDDVMGRVDILPLYGALPKDEQDRVFSQSVRRKVILATSIAETSVTIPGITCVIDSGLMRRSRFSASTGMSGLVTLPLTRDRAEQRRGRAGRVRPGRCYRLWTEGEERQRAERMTPEILEADLCSLVLSSAAWGATRAEGLPWLTPPAASAWQQAASLLESLGALDSAGRITAKGEAMSRLAMHPRLANMMLSAPDRQTASLLAAIIEEGVKSSETDIRRVLDQVRETPNDKFSRRIIALARKFIAPLERESDLRANSSVAHASEGAMLALAYPDRVAKSRGNASFRMVSGRGAALEQADPLAKAAFLVCCELDDRLGDARVFLAAPIAQNEVEEIFADAVIEQPYCEWDRREERVRCTRRRTLGQIVLSEVDARDAQPEAVAKAMLDGIRAKGIANLPSWTRDTLELRRRLAFLAKHVEGWPQPDDEALFETLKGGFMAGFSRWRDLEKLDLARVLDAFLAANGHTRQELERLAPARMVVPSGSNLLIHYDGEEPTVEARLQECFGLMQTPSIAGGKVPIVMTLLSPAHRPVQVTKDLAGFWRDGYQLVRKDMRGRYPKHYWPEDPFSAVATARTVKRK